MNGLEFTEAVDKGRPDIAIVVTSGFLKVPKNDLPSRIPFVAKPNDVGHVVNHTRELIFRSHEEDCFAHAFKP